MFKALWQFLANVKLTLYLLFLVALNLAIGALYIKFYPDTFRPLNQLLFQEWLTAYPTGKAWWTFSLFSLLALLGVNTFACTLERLTALWSRRQEYSFNRFFLIISPSLMHICFLVALSGHALSVFYGTHKEFPIKTGDIITLPAFTLEIKEVRPVFFENPLLQNPLKQCRVALDLKTPSRTLSKEISFLHPLWFRGWSFILDMNQKTKPGEPPCFRLLMKRDPGSKLILFGGIMLSFLMAWYFLHINQNKKER